MKNTKRVHSKHTGFNPNYEDLPRSVFLMLNLNVLSHPVKLGDMIKIHRL